jgi:hypothetical protein
MQPIAENGAASKGLVGSTAIPPANLSRTPGFRRQPIDSVLLPAPGGPVTPIR